MNLHFAYCFRKVKGLHLSLSRYLFKQILNFLNTYLGGVITTAAQRTFEPSMGAKTAEIVAGYCGKLTGSLLSFVISFLGNKFLVMRNWKVASYKAAIYEAEYEHAPAELLAADTEEE